MKLVKPLPVEKYRETNRHGILKAYYLNLYPDIIMEDKWYQLAKEQANLCLHMFVANNFLNQEKPTLKNLSCSSGKNT